MDLSVVEPALLALLARLTGVEPACCVLENAPRPRTNGALVLLSLVSLTTVGDDSAAWTFTAHADPLQEMVPRAEGWREAVYQVAVETAVDQRPATSARQLAERCRTRLRWESAGAELNAAGCALATVGPATIADYPADGRLVSRVLFEVRLNGYASEADAAGATSYIATVDVEGAVERPDGTPLPATLQTNTG